MNPSRTNPNASLNATAGPTAPVCHPQGSGESERNTKRTNSASRLAANDRNLNIPRYVEPKVRGEVLTVEEAVRRRRRGAGDAFSEEERLIAIPKQEGLLVPALP